MSKSHTENTKEEFLIQALLTQWGSFCNSCGAKRSTENIKIMKRSSEMIVLHINCNNCKAGHFISYQDKAPTFAMQPYTATDLQTDELNKLENPSVSTDDLIDAFMALDKVNDADKFLSLIQS
jgi:hypothetical protein